MINISIGSGKSVFLSSELPPLKIYADIDSVDVSVVASGGRNLFYTRIFISAIFDFDLRSVILADLTARGVAADSFSVSVKNPIDSSDSQSLSFSVIFSRGKFDLDSDDFLENNFLSLSDSKIIPKVNAFDSVSLWSEGNEFGSIYLEYLVGNVAKGYSNPIAATAGLNRIDVDFQDIISKLESGASPVSATLSVGARFMRYFFSDSHPSAAVSFLNNFNAPEHFWMFGQWKRSGKVARSTALCNREKISADLEVAPEFELSSQPLDFRQAYVIPEIAMSPSVWVYLFAEGSPLAKAAFKAKPVSGSSWRALAASIFKAVPTEGSLDASPQDPDPKAYTLKVVAAETEAALGFNYEIPRIFTKQFERQFI